METQVLTNTFMKVMEQVLSKMTGIVPSEPAQTKESDILEYDGRMRVGGLDKFNGPTYISVVNYYLNQGDKDRHKAKGALVLYMDLENTGKLLKALGFTFPDDEDDVSMMAACGEFCDSLGKAFKDELSQSGFADLIMSAPQNYKNSIIEGIEYSTDQKMKQEFSFFYWRRKSIVVELTLAAIPQKGR